MTNPKGEVLVVRIEEILSDVFHDLGVDPGLTKDGVEANLQELLAEKPQAIENGLSLLEREYLTEIGPVDLLCRDDGGQDTGDDRWRWQAPHGADPTGPR